MKKRYVLAIIAILSALLGVLEQLSSQGFFEKQSIGPMDAREMVDSIMEYTYNTDEFLTSSEEGLGYYYGAYLEDVLGDDYVTYHSAMKKGIMS